jgi:RimJ/RimL family protein N-acetyltransferase
MKYDIIYKTYGLRPLTHDDVSDKYLSWLQDKEVTEFLEIRYHKFELDDLYDYIDSFVDNPNKYLFGVFDTENDNHIGNATLYNIKYPGKTFDLGLLIGEKDYWGKNPGLYTVLMLMKYAFEVLNLRKFVGGCYSEAIKSRFILKRILCEQEARIRQMFLYNDQFVDQIIYTLDHERYFDAVKDKFDL